MWKTRFKGKEIIGTYEELCELTKGMIAQKFERIKNK